MQRLAHAAYTRCAAGHRKLRAAARDACADAGEYEPQNDKSDEEGLGHARTVY